MANGMTERERKHQNRFKSFQKSHTFQRTAGMVPQMPMFCILDALTSGVGPAFAFLRYFRQTGGRTHLFILIQKPYRMLNPQFTMADNSQEYRLEYWATRLSIRSFAHSLAPLPRSLALDCSLRSRPPLRSLVRSLAHFAHSLARGKVN